MNDEPESLKGTSWLERLQPVSNCGLQFMAGISQNNLIISQPRRPTFKHEHSSAAQISLPPPLTGQSSVAWQSFLIGVDAMETTVPLKHTPGPTLPTTTTTTTAAPPTSTTTSTTTTTTTSTTSTTTEPPPTTSSTTQPPPTSTTPPPP